MISVFPSDLPHHTIKAARIARLGRKKAFRKKPEGSLFMLLFSKAQRLCILGTVAADVSRILFHTVVI